jgi:hypothetical protein
MCNFLSFFLSGINSAVSHVQEPGSVVKVIYRGIELGKIPYSSDKFFPLPGRLAFDSAFFDFYPFPVIGGFGDFAVVISHNFRLLAENHEKQVYWNQGKAYAASPNYF